MIRAESAFMLCVLVAAVGVVLGHTFGYDDGYKDGHQQGLIARKPMPPATICTMKMPSSKYKQLDCVRHAWRIQ